MKLVGPKITDGEWYEFPRDVYPIVKSNNGEQIAWCGYNDNGKANARFLAGSKRVAEAAVNFLNAYPENAMNSPLLQELRAALIAAGYREE